MIHPLETRPGNPDPTGQSRTAARLAMTLDNEGLASISANYLEPIGADLHGYESLAIHGMLGLVESLCGGTPNRLVIGSTDYSTNRFLRSRKIQIQHLLEHLALGSPHAYAPRRGTLSDPLDDPRQKNLDALAR